MKRKPEEKPRCSVCGWPLAASVSEGCIAGNCSMRLWPEPRKMLADLLPGLRYAVNRLRDRGQLYDAAAIERDIAMIEDGKIPPFLEQSE